MFNTRFWLALGAFAVFALLAVVGARSAVAQSECAHYISGGADYMGNGSLLGWKRLRSPRPRAVAYQLPLARRAGRAVAEISAAGLPPPRRSM